jgi:hypothetical protein
MLGLDCDPRHCRGRTGSATRSGAGKTDARKTGIHANADCQACTGRQARECVHQKGAGKEGHRQAETPSKDNGESTGS